MCVQQFITLVHRFISPRPPKAQRLLKDQCDNDPMIISAANHFTKLREHPNDLPDFV